MREPPEVVRKELEGWRKLTPLHCVPSRDFGPLWLVRTGDIEEGAHSGLVAPQSCYEWLGAFPIPNMPDALIRMRPDDADHTLNGEALLIAARDLEPLEDEQTPPTYENLRLRLMVRGALDGEAVRWPPKRLRPSQILVKVEEETRDLFRRFRDNFAAVWERVNRELQAAFDASGSKVDLTRVRSGHRMTELLVDDRSLVLCTTMPGYSADFRCGWDSGTRDFWLSVWHLDAWG
jgi:hypothetical protein